MGALQAHTFTPKELFTMTGFVYQGHPRAQERGYPCVTVLGGHTRAHRRPQVVAGIRLGSYRFCLLRGRRHTRPGEHQFAP